MSHCPICKDISKVYHQKKHGDYKIQYCSGCQLQFSIPKDDHGGMIYQKSVLYEFRCNDTLLEIPSHDWRYQTCFKSWKIKPMQSLLDIGCGEGGFLALAQSKGFNVFGIDIDERAIHLAKNIYNLKNVESGRWEKIKNIKGWKDFDVITLFDMLEHVPSPVSLVTSVFGLLKRGGLVCVSVPRLDRYPKIFNIEVDFPPHHFTLWTSNAISRLFKKVGFRKVSIIEKPLMAEDLYAHLCWEKERFIRKLRGLESEHRTERSLNNRQLVALKKTVKVKLIIKRSILLVLTVFVWFLRILRLGRGFTLLATAKKPI